MIVAGKSFELMGLAAFNVFLAMILSVTFLTEAEKAVPTKLSKPVIEEFFDEVALISSGNHPEMDQYETAAYFMRHIADDSKFESQVQYQLTSVKEAEEDMAFDKPGYIANIIAGQKQFTDYESSTRIELVEISTDQKSANVTTTSFERGNMNMDDGFGGTAPMPIRSVSYCKQKLVLADRAIKMAGATCTTNVRFAETM